MRIAENRNEVKNEEERIHKILNKTIAELNSYKNVNVIYEKGIKTETKKNENGYLISINSEDPLNQNIKKISNLKAKLRSVLIHEFTHVAVQSTFQNENQSISKDSDFDQQEAEVIKRGKYALILEKILINDNQISRDEKIS